MEKKFKVLCISVLCLLFAHSVQAKLFDISEYQLSNGATLLVIPNHKAPIAKHMVWYKIGAVDETVGKGGSAHLLEHLMFRGTKKVTGTEFNRLMQINGADSNAFTSFDYTAYHQNLDISRLELAMALEADRMQNLNFSDADFVTERDIVYQERKQVVENKPLAVFSETMKKILWQNHPYAKPITGTEEEILSLTKDDIMQLYQHYYAPENAVIVISGDIEPQIAFELAEKYYGKVPARTSAKPKSFPTINANTNAKLRMSLPRVEIPRLIRTYVTDSYNTNPDNIYALSILSAYLGEGETSELYKELIQNRNLALSVSTSYDYASRSYGTFDIAAVPAKDVSMKKLTEKLDKVIRDAVFTINDEKIERVKNKMLAGLIYLKDNPFDAANIVGALYTIGMSKEDIENYADSIRRTTTEQVRHAAEELLYKSPVTEGIVYPIDWENKDE